MQGISKNTIDDDNNFHIKKMTPESQSVRNKYVEFISCRYSIRIIKKVKVKHFLRIAIIPKIILKMENLSPRNLS